MLRPSRRSFLTRLGGGLLLLTSAGGPMFPLRTAGRVAAMPGAGLAKPAVLNRYEMDVSYDPSARTIGGTFRLRYTNNTRESLSDLWFHLYPNAPQYQRAAPGSLKLSDVTVDGQAVTPEAEAFHVRLALPRPVAPGEGAVVELRFVTTITGYNDRFGYTGSVANLGGWYPILAAYDGGWRRDEFIDLGDPYYSEVAAYRVGLTVPAGYTVASTGVAGAAETTASGDARAVYEAENVRDFALAISRRFDVVEREVLGTTIRVYAAEATSDAQARATLDAAAASFRAYSDLFGAYPYPNLSVVTSFEGMEYPRLVFVGANGDEFTTAHEVAHQWWYGVVGNDELHDLWDESLTSYSTLLYYEQRYGADRFRNELAGHATSFRNQSPAARAELCVGCDLYYYRDRAYAYSPGVYRKGGAMFHALRQRLGDDTFFAFLRGFYRRYQFATATWNDLIGAASDAAGRDLTPFFQSWLPAGAEG